MSPEEYKRAVDELVAAAFDPILDERTRALSAVRGILHLHYPLQAELVRRIVWRPDLVGLQVTAPSTNDSRGTISVGRAFLAGMEPRLTGRRVLQVGHELQHVVQQRLGLGGQRQRPLREFLAHSWAALQPDPPGTRAVPHRMRVEMCDAALSFYDQLTDELRIQHLERRDQLFARRALHNGRGGNPLVPLVHGMVPL